MFFDRADVPRPSRSASGKAKRLLERALGPSKVVTSADSRAAYARDESEAARVVPDAVVLAETTEDVLEALRVGRHAEVPIT